VFLSIYFLGKVIFSLHTSVARSDQMRNIAALLSLKKLTRSQVLHIPWMSLFL